MTCPNKIIIFHRIIDIFTASGMTVWENIKHFMNVGTFKNFNEDFGLNMSGFCQETFKFGKFPILHTHSKIILKL